MSEDMSEKDVRKYARRNVTKNVFIERPLLNSRRLGPLRRLKTDVAAAILA